MKKKAGFSIVEQVNVLVPEFEKRCLYAGTTKPSSKY